MTAREAPDHDVVIIGAGFSGLGAAIALKRAGIEDFAILERADDIGGTWRANTYPDVAVDIPSLQLPVLVRAQPGLVARVRQGPEVKAYIDGIADKYGAAPRTCASGTEVARARVGRGRACCGGSTCSAAGRSHRALVIAALGAFVDPRRRTSRASRSSPARCIRTQEWDHDYDLTGKRVAVIGTGASAVQLIPPVARAAGRLHVFQRRRSGCSPSPTGRSGRARGRFRRRVPGLQNAVRLGRLGDRRVVARRDGPARPALPAADQRSPSAPAARSCARRSRTPSCGASSRPTTASAASARGCRTRYHKTFKRENTELVTEPIERITPSGILTEDGREREIDVLVLATGFRISTDPENYRGSPVRGRDGFDLADFVQNQPLQAYEGVSIPGCRTRSRCSGPTRGRAAPGR